MQSSLANINNPETPQQTTSDHHQVIETEKKIIVSKAKFDLKNVQPVGSIANPTK